MEYRTIVFEREHEVSVADFYSILSEKDAATNKAYLEWKYDQNPWIDRRLMVLCYHGDQLVGMRGAFGTLWETKSGEQIVLPHADDLLIHPDHRSKGLFTPMMKELERATAAAGHKTLISLSGGEDTQKLQLGTGWREMQSLKSLSNYGYISENASSERNRRIFVHRVSLALSGRLLNFRTIRSNRDIHLRLIIQQLIRSNPHLQKVRGAHFADIRDSLEQEHTTPIWPVRNSTFHNWRLCNPNRRAYIVRWLIDQTCGYLILTWAKHWPSSVQIIDFGSTEDSVFEEMIAAIARALPVPLQILENSLSESQQQIAHRLGFSHAVQGFPTGKKKRFLLKHLKGTDEHRRTLLESLSQAPIHAAEKMLG